MKQIGPEPTQYAAFKNLLERVLSVPHEEIVRREEAYQRQAKASPVRRGPKPKKPEAK